MRPTFYPSINDIIMVMPTKIADHCVYVQLMEYNNIEGFIIMSDMTKQKRCRSINKIVTVGKNFPACVQTVEEKTGQITLSKKAVNDEESKTCANNYRTMKFINDMMNFFVSKLKKEYSFTKGQTSIGLDSSVDVDYAYRIFIWALSCDPDFLIFALKSASKDFNKVYQNKLEGIEPNIIECFKKVLSLKFKEKDVILEAIMEISCLKEAGINIIKTALITGLSMETVECPFKIKMVKSPYYSMTVKTSHQESAVPYLNEVISKIKTELENNGATFKIVKQPEIVLDKEFEPEDSASDSENDSESE